MTRYFQRMTIPSSKTLHKWLGACMVLVLIISVATWYLTREKLPRVLRVATGSQGGLYHDLGKRLTQSYERQTGRAAEVLPTEGSVDNRKLLLSGQADIAILQGGAVQTDGLSIIAPLYPEMVHVIVRKDSRITRIEELAGHRLVLGEEGSGMRVSAMQVLRQYGLGDKVVADASANFMELLNNDHLEGAVVTTGVLNPDLRKLLGTGSFKLLPIESAAAIEMKDAYFTRNELPRGLYGENPSVPMEAVPTVATTAFLVVREDAPDLLIESALTALYAEGLLVDVPVLIRFHEAANASPLPLHPTARQYFNPTDQISLVANVMEAIAAFKELLFAFAAGGYLLWDRWKRLKEKERQKLVREAKDHLDTFLEKTLRIEEAQMRSTNVAELKGYLDEVTTIKLTALRQLTEEELRSDQAFAIFLMQCANLINKIQFKIASRQPRKDGTDAVVDGGME